MSSQRALIGERRSPGDCRPSQAAIPGDLPGRQMPVDRRAVLRLATVLHKVERPETHPLAFIPRLRYLRWTMTVTVRFAPSPTGNIHIGNTRTALFNWLFALQN